MGVAVAFVARVMAACDRIYDMHAKIIPFREVLPNGAKRLTRSERAGKEGEEVKILVACEYEDGHAEVFSRCVSCGYAPPDPKPPVREALDDSTHFYDDDGIMRCHTECTEAQKKRKPVREEWSRTLGCTKP